MCVCVSSGGGGGHPKNWDTLFNTGIIRCASSAEDTRAECPTYGITENGTRLNIIGNFCKRRRRERLGGYGGMPPPPKKILM